MSDKYILDENGVPVLETDLLKWGRWFEKSDRHVARTQVSDDVFVSTIFLGLDHSFSGGDPILWETLIFGGPHHGDGSRYTTREDALAGHERFVAKAQ